MSNQSSHRGGFKLIELGTFAVLIALVFSVFVPGYIRAKDKAKEAETKENLHAIQVGVERYRVDRAGEDSEGSYPPYLIGGSFVHQTVLLPRNVKEYDVGSTRQHVSDPLLHGGYLSNYPANPFMRGKGGGMDVLKLQAQLPSSTVYGCDPLRPGTAESQAGLRFGQLGELMGSALADPRCKQWARPGESLLTTYADVEYEFWDVADGQHGQRFLPGEFFYKAYGLTLLKQAVPEWGNLAHDAIDHYTLAAYGSLTKQGADVLGPEAKWRARIGSRGNELTYKTYPNLTRSEVGTADEIDGSPFRPRDPADIEHPLFDNPNGASDGILLRLFGEPVGSMVED